MEYHGNVRVSDHLLWLIQEPVSYDLMWPPTGAQGFVHFGAGGAIIKTGVSGGLVDVTVSMLDAEPPVDTSWDDISEGDLRTTEGGVYVAGGYSFENVIPGGSGGFTPRGPTAHRVRVSASGRALKYDELGDDEKYLVEMWPTSVVAASKVHQFKSGR
jgi:hypothetical protein